ncbi:MAG: phage holin family protein [Candidatus Gracilibacteria bacterium]|nr:phage holin family protein [Candidatus Gracilibacteria bacterium]
MGLIKKVIVGIVLNGLALYALTYVLEEVVYTGGIKFFIIGGLVLGILNLIVKPLFKIIAFPLIFLTGGLFLIVINAVILAFLSYFLGVIEFRDVTLTFPNIGSYVIGGLVFGVVNWLAHLIIKNK